MEGQCSQRVSDSTGLYYHQCHKKAVVEREGRLYCKVHNPEYIKEKRRKEQEKYNKEQDERQEEYARHDALEKATEGLTTEELERLTPDLCRAAPKMQAALKMYQSHQKGTLGHYCWQCANAIEQALALAEPELEEK